MPSGSLLPPLIGPLGALLVLAAALAAFGLVGLRSRDLLRATAAAALTGGIRLAVYVLLTFVLVSTFLPFGG